MTKEEYINLYAFQKILDHLEYNKTHETRKREQLRSKIASKTINKWLKMGEEDYAKRQS